MIKHHDSYTQKCWVSVSHFSRLSVPLGTCVRISFSTNACPVLCELYPNKSLSSDICLVQSTVQTFSDDFAKLSFTNTVSIRPFYALDLHIVPILFTAQPSLIEIKVVVKSPKDIPRLKSYPHGLPSLVKDLLLPYTFTNQSCISLTSHPLGIISILILSSDAPADHLIQLSSQTSLKIVKISTENAVLEVQRNSRIVLGGLASPYAELKRLVTLPLYRSHVLSELGLDCAKSLLLHGPPGCGKTSLVKKLAVDCQAMLLVVPGASLSSPNPGETEERLQEKIQEAIEANWDGPCILFFDEIDALCPRRGSGHSHETRVVAQLLTLLDRLKAEPNIVVIGATNRVEELDPAVRRPGRLNKEVYIGVPSAAERADIIETICKASGVKLDCDVHWLSELTPGYVGADLALLCQEIAARVKEQQLSKASEMLFKQVLANIRPSSMRKGLGVVDFRPVSWSEIGGLENAKHYVERAIEWPLKYPDAFLRLGIDKPKGVLLYGPPGCGKSLLVRAAATSCSVTFLSVSAAEVFSSYVGDSEKTVSNLFQRARLAAPCILFLDELDAMVGDRSQTQGHRAQASVISTFLQEMDGVALHSTLSSKLGQKFAEDETSPEIQMITDKVRSEGVLVVGATNRPDKIDAALLRPGRLDSLVYIPPPDSSTRTAILQVHTSKMPLKDVDLVKIAERTDWFSGADLEVLCKEAGLKALEEDMEAIFVTQSHFTSALKTVKPSLNAKIVSWYENYQNNR